MLVQALDNQIDLTSLKVTKTNNTGMLCNLNSGNASDCFIKKSGNNPSKDGKFSFLQAAKNFGKGLISPITGMFSSPKNFLVSAGAILGTAALYAIGLGPAVIAFWAGYGLIQGGLGIHKIITEKDPDKKEEAFFDVGEATFIVGTSVLCAKATLKDSGVNTSKMSAMKATLECFKKTPKSIAQSVSKIKNFTSPFHFAKSTIKQVDTSSITDAYGQVFPVMKAGASKAGMGVNFRHNDNQAE